MRLLAWALSCALCATAAWADDTADPFAGIHTIAIVSLVGDGLTLKQDRDLFGAAAPDVVLATGADIDGFIAAQIARAVGGRFTIVDAAVDPALLNGGGLPPQLAAKLHALPAGGSGPDALIVVHPITIEQRLDQPQYTMRFSYNGLSATRSTGLFGGHSILLSAQFEVLAIDARTGRTIGSAKARAPATGMFGRRPDPIEICDDAFWPQHLDRPSPDQLLQIRAELRAIIAASLPNALQAARLTALGNDTKPKMWDGRVLLCHEMG